jgi:hypothetical protein
MTSITDTVALPRPGRLQIRRRADPDVLCFNIDFKDEEKVLVWRAAIEQQVKACKELAEQSELVESLPSSDFAWMHEGGLVNPHAQQESDDDSYDDDDDIVYRILEPVAAGEATQFPKLFKVRVAYKGNFVTLMISTNITYQRFINRIDAKVGRFSSNSISRGQLKLRYFDEDGDFVSVICDEDLQLALAEKEQRFKGLAPSIVKVNFYCVDSQPTAEQ